jgi:hypothetical protein
MTELKKWTIRRTSIADPPPALPPAFIVPLPTIRPVPPPPEAATDIEAVVHRKFPCPVKVRYKYREILYQSVSIQTEV